MKIKDYIFTPNVKEPTILSGGFILGICIECSDFFNGYCPITSIKGHRKWHRDNYEN